MAENKEIIWSGVQVFMIKGASFFFSIFMARLVAPAAYGLIAMVSVFIAFFQLFVDSGLGNALIQKTQKNDIDYHTTFISNLVISLILYVILFFIAPYIADFYHQSSLVAIIRWISLSLVIQSFYLIQRCRLTIRIDFKTQAKAGVLSTLLSGVIGIIFAYYNYGVWALVIQMLSGQILTAALIAWYTKWIPALKFSYSSFKVLFKYGSKDLVGNIFTSFFMNISNLLIGKFYSPANLAFYNRGFNLGYMPAGMIQESLSRVSFPLQCKYQNDREALLATYNKYIGLSAFINFPIMITLACLAKPLVLVLLTDKWAGAVPYTQLMALAFFFHPVNTCIAQVVNAVGYPGRTVKAVIVKRIIALILLIVTVRISVMAVAVSLLISNYLEVIISGFVSSRTLHINFVDQFRPILKPLMASIVCGICIIAVCRIIENYYLQILISIVVSGFAYISLAYMMRMKERTGISRIYTKFISKK